MPAPHRYVTEGRSDAACPFASGNPASVASGRVFRPGERGQPEPVQTVETGEACPEPPGPRVSAAFAAIDAFVRHRTYPCTGAKSALNKQTHRMGFYGSIRDTESGRCVAADLAWFADSADGIDDTYATFVAVFEPAVLDPAGFETALWAQLQAMNETTPGRAWDPAYSDDPADVKFAFSLAGEAFYVIGMHPLAEREARRFPYPILIFNLHRQFEKLRAEGRFDPMRTLIREREEALAGAPNPFLSDHGMASEAPQYAGCPHAAGWRPAFRNVNAGERPAAATRPHAELSAKPQTPHRNPPHV